ncbi:MAG TPA: hypothetical protein VNJ02_16870 [Vicinamibacterales bacterium]|nr:hypothetical protein [Vicinamibacterales bacterium]
MVVVFEVAMVDDLVSVEMPMFSRKERRQTHDGRDECGGDWAQVTEHQRTSSIV